MPSAPMPYCATSGCSQRVPHGHCAQHAKDKRRARRFSDDPRYRTRKWTEYSVRYRAEHPFCTHCGRLAQVVDHIVPVWAAPERFEDETNHQPLCRSCNRVKAEDDAQRYRVPSSMPTVAAR